MLAVGKQDQRGASACAKDGEAGIGQQPAQGGGAVAINGAHAGAFDDGFNELFWGELASLRFVRIRRVDDLELIIAIDSVVRSEGRKVVIRIIVRVRRIREEMSTPLQRYVLIVGLGGGGCEGVPAAVLLHQCGWSTGFGRGG